MLPMSRNRIPDLEKLTACPEFVATMMELIEVKIGAHLQPPLQEL